MKNVQLKVIRSKLRHASYKECLCRRKSHRETMITFRSEKHQIHSIALNKTTLPPFDDKRYILNDEIHTLAHGHWRISRYTTSFNQQGYTMLNHQQQQEQQQQELYNTLNRQLQEEAPLQCNTTKEN